ncbi:MAG: hypothetical protein ACLTCI_11105 [[Clostridium] nexile]
MPSERTDFCGVHSKNGHATNGKSSSCFDLMEDHCLAVENSVATAEGMIAEAMIRSLKSSGEQVSDIGIWVAEECFLVERIRCEVGRR